ncbi:---NA---, partial [Paramuricea clavata]
MALAPLKIQYTAQVGTGVEEKEEILPHAEACETRGQLIDFMVINSSTDSDEKSTSSVSTKTFPNRYQCQQCSVSCRSKKKLESHVLNSHGSKKNKAEDSEVSFVDLTKSPVKNKDCK